MTTVDESIAQPQSAEPSGRLIRRVYEVEVLYREGYTETDLNSASLESLAYETDQGAASGLVSIKSTEVLTPKDMAAALRRQGSDPEFLLDSEVEHLHVECSVNWPDGTWTAGHFVTVPADLDDAEVERQGIATLEAQFKVSGVTVASVGVHHWSNEVCDGGPDCPDAKGEGE